MGLRYVKTGAGYVTDPGAGPDQWQVQYEWQDEVGAYVTDPGGGPDQWQVTPVPSDPYPADFDLNLLSTIGSGTFDRADATSCATYTDPADGLLKTVAANVPRFEARGLLFEPAITNLCLRSATLDNAYWTATGLTSRTVGAGDPTGGSGAYTLTEDTGTSQHGIITAGITITAGARVSFSFYARAGTASRIALEIVNDTGTPTRLGGARFNLSDGTSASFSATGYTVADFGADACEPSGMYRCRVSMTTATDTTVYAKLSILDDSNNQSYLGTSRTITAWGGMAHQGYLWAANYIATGASAVTKSHDLLTIPAVDHGLTDTSGGFAITMTPEGGAAVATEGMSLARFASTGGLLAYRNSGTQNFISYDSTAVVNWGATSVFVARTPKTYCFTWGAGTMSGQVYGGPRVDQTFDGTWVNVTNPVAIGDVAGGRTKMWVSRARFWAARLSDDALAALSAI